MANKKDVAEVVAVISAAYPHFEPTEHTVEVFFQSLKSYDPELLKLATIDCVNELGRKFAPSVGELREAIARVQRKVNNIPSSYEAWQEVGQQILVNGGDFGNPVWSHPIVGETVRVIGWRNLRMSENPVADRARFIQAYEQLQSRFEEDTMLIPEVRGYIEKSGGKLLSPVEQIKQLVDGMKKS